MGLERPEIIASLRVHPGRKDGAVRGMPAPLLTERGTGSCGVFFFFLNTEGL